jgi:hypothetical protein
MRVLSEKGASETGPSVEPREGGPPVPAVVTATVAEQQPGSDCRPRRRDGC